MQFEFVYGNYVINIADYTREVSYQHGYSTIEPEGKISVLIEKHGEQLSDQTVKKLAYFINQRILGSVITSSCNMIDLNIQSTDQFMKVLLDAIDIIIPN